MQIFYRSAFLYIKEKLYICNRIIKNTDGVYREVSDV